MTEIVYLHQLSRRARQQDAGAQHQRDPVILLVPSAELSCLQLEVGQVPSRYRQQALPALLDERLLQELDQLHLASGVCRDGLWPVLVVSETQMQEWLDTAHVCGVEPVAIYPDFYSLKEPDNCAVLAVQEGQGILRLGAHQGTSGDVDQMIAFVRHARSEQLRLETDGSAVVVWPESQLQRRPWEAVNVRVYGEPIDLRQGVFARSDNKGRGLRRWWPQLGLAALLLLASACNLFLQSRYYQADNTRLTQALSEHYQRLLGSTPEGADWMAQARYQRRLIDLAGDPVRQQAWQLLKSFGLELQRCSSCRIEAASVQGRQLELILEVSGSESLLRRIEAGPRWRLIKLQRQQGKLLMTLALRESQS